MPRHWKLPSTIAWPNHPQLPLLPFFFVCYRRRLFIRSNLISSRWIWLEFKHSIFYACPSYLQVWWWSDQKYRRYRIQSISSGAQGQVTPKSMDGIWSGLKSNSSMILCLSWLKALLCPQHFLHYKMRRSRARKNKAYCPIGPKIELIQDDRNL